MSEEAKNNEENESSESGYKIKERAYKLWKKGYSMADIASKINKSERTLYRWKDEREWDERLDKEKALVKQQETMTEVELARENLTNLNRLLHRAIGILEDSMGSAEDLVMLRGAVRDYGNLMDKVIRAMAFVDNGGADMTRVKKTEEKLDWNQLIHQSLEAKKEYGDQFDEKEFAKKAIDAAFNRTKK